MIAYVVEDASLDDENDEYDFCSAEWLAWYRLTPAQRWKETERLWQVYLELGGSLDPEPDTQSPFFDADSWSSTHVDGRAGLHIVRRSGI